MIKDKIKIIKNFISDYDIDMYRNYNSWLLDNKPEPNIGGDGTRATIRFGRDLFFADRSHESLDGIVDPEMIRRINSLWTKTIRTTQAVFEDEKELYPCSFWIVKQYPGAKVDMHIDNDQGTNMHFKYSAVLYLNTLTSGGELDFPELGYAIKPEAGDLVVFTSQDTGPHQVISIPEVRDTLPMWFTEDKSFSLFKD